MNKDNDIFDGRTIFSGAEAAQYARTPEGTFKDHVFNKNRIPNGKKIGNRLCFTRAQLDDYRENKFSQLEFDVDVLTAAEAAEYLGVAKRSFDYYLYGTEFADQLPYERVGGSGLSDGGGERKGGIIVFTKETLDAFKVSVAEVNHVN